jgi:hypothetical protein
MLECIDPAEQTPSSTHPHPAVVKLERNVMALTRICSKPTFSGAPTDKMARF